MRLKFSALLFAAAAVLSGTGCASLKYVPSEASPAPKAAGAPLPLIVGVAFNPKFAPDAPALNDAGVRVDPVKSLTEALRTSGLFREVRVPLSGDQGVPSNVDLLIASDYDLKFVVDPGMLGKVLLSMLILPAPFVTFTDNYTGEATLDVKDASGRTLKQYHEKASVEPTYQMFSEGTADRDSYPMLIRNLTAALVADLVKDRSFYQHVAPASSQPAAAAEAGAAPAQPAWWKQ